MGTLKGFPNPPAMSSAGQSPSPLDADVLKCSNLKIPHKFLCGGSGCDLRRNGYGFRAGRRNRGRIRGSVARRRKVGTAVGADSAASSGGTAGELSDDSWKRLGVGGDVPVSQQSEGDC